MRTFHGRGSPFLERPHFSDWEIDQMCEEALLAVGLLPSNPEPIRVERFIEKRFGVSPVYEDLPAGVLGYTLFTDTGVRSVHVGNHLVGNGEKPLERRLNSTLAHEAGHCLMHAHLFAFKDVGLSLFGRDPDVSATKVLCRDAERQIRQTYDGRWWELQANKSIGALLLPRRTLRTALEPFLIRPGELTEVTVPESLREDAVRSLAEIFDVNPAVSRIRLNTLYPLGDGG
ncbi:ImmA/IrrE family metallo-endopeptidase [Geothrix sp. 21YS21S-2]|uniref:ImmA/IrrE family metallo-endopeptidase n=1 Tax=Geothrix sp. 21YS21S-2 TaxID=3068893 RepID=UPI0027B94F47|nr:hypothetical protein [Geothrix sp. 21YS21S-2]